MASDQGLLQTIIEQPDDDAPRLIYADWLDDQGEAERAEFIRVQCELASLADDHERRPVLERREIKLAGLRKTWVGKLPRGEGIEYTFRRGFVAEASLRWKLFLEHGEQVFQLAPIRQLELSYLGMGKFLAAAVGSRPELLRLHGLKLKGQLGEPGLQDLLRAPNLKGLKSLGLAWTGCEEQSLKIVLGGRLPTLEALDLTSCGMAAHINLLSKAQLPLRELNLHANELLARDMTALAQAPGLAGLTRLNLSSNSIRVGGAQALTESKVLQNLTRLNVSGCSIGIAGAAALAGSANFAGLRSLDLSANKLGSRGLGAVVEAPHLRQLHTLNLGANELDDRSIPILLGWPGLASLRSLELSANAFTSQGLAQLRASDQLARLWSPI